jgi:hypothetical protein
VSVSTIIAIVAGVVALAALAGSWMLSRRIKAAESRATELARLASAGDIQGIARQVDARLSALEEANECRKADDAALADRLGRAVRHVGLVRFDAFDNTAGAQSFSLALLDDAGDGIVMTSIYGRGEYRVYAKPVTDRVAGRLTEEERQAIDSAFSSSVTGGG